MNNKSIGSAYTITVPNHSDLVVKHGASCFWMTTRAFRIYGKAQLHLVTYCPTQEAVRVWDDEQQRWRRDHVVSTVTQARIKTKWFREVNDEWSGKKVDVGHGDEGRVIEVSPDGVEVGWECGIRTIERFDRVIDGWLPLPGKKVGA